MSSPTIEKRNFEGVTFGDQVVAFMSEDPETLWKLVKEYEKIGFRGTSAFAVYAGEQIQKKCGPEKLLALLERDKLKDKDLAKQLEEGAKSKLSDK